MSGTPDTAERVARNALLKTGTQATRLLSLSFVVVAARVIGPEEFGKFTFAYALATLLGAALDLGMHSILVRGIARARADTPAYWAAAVTLKLVLLAAAGAVFLLLPLATRRPFDTTAAAWLLGTAIALQSFIELAVCVFTGFERLEFELGTRVVEKIVLVSVGIAGLALGGRLLAVSGAFTVAAAVSLTLAVALVHRRFARLRWRWDAAGASALGRALGPVAAAFLLAFATTRLVPLLVALLAGDLAAGYFGAAIRVLDVVMVLPIIVVAAVYPVLVRLGPADPQFRRVVVHVVGLLLMIGLPVALGFAYGADWLVVRVYGPRFGPAAAPLAVLGAAAALGYLSYFLGFVLLALDRAGRLVGVTAASLAASVALTPGLVLALGALGGAIALVLVEVVAIAGSLVALIPFIRLPFDRGVLKVGVAGLGAGFVASLLPAAGGGRLAALLLVYVAGLLALRPVPVTLWGRLLRGAVGGGPVAGASR
jgi:O-antigen/teichoic acid export membrane protein